MMEPGSDVGIEHAAPGIPPDAAEFRACCARVAHKCRRPLDALHVLDLFGSLPEEQVGADGCSKDADHHGCTFRIGRESWPEGVKHHLPPRHVYGKQHCGIGQQGESQPFQEEDVTVIGDEYLEQQCRDDEEHCHQVPVEAADEFSNFAHGRNVGGDIQSISDQQEQHDAPQDDRGKSGFDIRRETFPGHPAEPRTHRLDCGHQREGDRHRPEHVKPELGAGLGICNYPAGIVISHTGDEPRPEARQRVLLQAVREELSGVLAPSTVDRILGDLHSARKRRP
jgi:hypothetical protein